MQHFLTALFYFIFEKRHKKGYAKGIHKNWLKGLQKGYKSTSVQYRTNIENDKIIPILAKKVS